VRIRVLNVEFSYSSTPALRGVTLEVEPGEAVFVIGPNGAGKTTLLKVIAGILRPTGGAVYIDGKDYRYYNAKELAKIVGYVDPHPSRSIPSTVYEFLISGRYPHQSLLQFAESEEDRRIVDRVCRRLGILHLLTRRLDQLSSGELQRVVLARALVQNPRVLLLDEPSAFLDLRYRIEVLSYVRDIVKTENRSAVVAVHDLYLASLFADKVVLMDRGMIVAAGAPEEVLRKDIISEVYGVEVEIIRIDDRIVVVPISAKKEAAE